MEDASSHVDDDDVRLSMYFKQPLMRLQQNAQHNNRVGLPISNALVSSFIYKEINRIRLFRPALSDNGPN